MSFQLSSVICSMDWIRILPALFTRISIGPSCALGGAHQLRHVSARETSAWIAIARRPELLNFSHGGMRIVAALAIIHRDVAARARQRQRDRAANSPPSSSDEGDFPGELFHVHYFVCVRLLYAASTNMSAVQNPPGVL